MKAITVLQPWATLMAEGKKRIYTPSWKTNYRGELIIHASRSAQDFFSEIYADDELYPYFRKAGIGKYKIFYAMPRGMIIGKANVVNCLLIDEITAQLIKEQNPDEYAFGDFIPGRYAWILEDPVLFENPIPASGRQKLWNWEGEYMDV